MRGKPWRPSFQTVMRWFSSRPKSAPARGLLSGTLDLGGREWSVREERRQGPQKQLFVLEAADGSGSVMHVHSPPETEITTLDEVAALSENPTARWLTGRDGRRWEARIVVRSEPGVPDVPLVKFLSAPDVREVEYAFEDGLGRRTDDEIRGILDS